MKIKNRENPTPKIYLRKIKIVSLEWNLGVEFPSSYRQFLLEKESAVIGGFSILGLPTEEVKLSMLEGTLILRKKRNDLPEALVVISLNPIVKGKVLCLDLREPHEEDCPLVETNLLKESDPLILVSDSFSNWIEGQKQKEERFKLVRLRIRNRQNEIRTTVFRGIIEKKFGSTCPVCQKADRGDHLVCKSCYKAYISEAGKVLAYEGKVVQFLDWFRERVETKGVTLPKFSQKGGEEVYHIYTRPQDWHCRTVEVHDYTVILTAFRHSYALNCLEVDECWSVDDPRFPKGEATKHLLILLLSMASQLSGSLSIAFTRDIREIEEIGIDDCIIETNWRKVLHKLPPDLQEEALKNKGRIHCQIPEEIVDLVNRYGVTFEEEQIRKGRINHDIGTDIFIRLFEFPPEVLTRIGELAEAGCLTREALCFILAAGIWSREEVIWFFENTPRPEAIILGTDLPEDRLLYSDSLNYGRSALLVSRLRDKVFLDVSGGRSAEEHTEAKCFVEPKQEFWVLRSNKNFYLPWLADKTLKIEVPAGKPVLLLSRPLLPGQPEYNKRWLEQNLRILNKIKAEFRCLLLSFEFSDLEHGMRFSEGMKRFSVKAAQLGIYILFSPYRSELLSAEVESRMSRARKIRQFSPRSSPPNLQVIEVPKERWLQNDLLYSVGDAKTAATWITQRTDLHLGRMRFSINCQCIERIALQDNKSRKVAEFKNELSENLLVALKSEHGITFPFVLPEDMPLFLKKVKTAVRVALKEVKGGLVVVASPYEKSNIRLVVKPITGRRDESSARRDFRFPEIRLEKYKISRPEEIERAHKQIREAITNGAFHQGKWYSHPLAVSYFRHEILPEVLRDYIYYHKDSLSLWQRLVSLFKGKRPHLPIMLRVVYSDGTEGQPFPLFCLPKKTIKADNFYRLPVGLISMRHATLDLIAEGYLIQNIMLERRETSAEQEDYAFRRAWYFLTNTVDLLQHKRVQEITKDIRFKDLWQRLSFKDRKYQGCELHIYQTGLEPAVLGTYRAVVEFLRKRRRELVVVPRLISRQDRKEMINKRITVGKSVDYYVEAAEWY